MICHPPYFNLYRYSSVYRFEMLWLGFDYKKVRSKEVEEGFKLGRKEVVNDYVRDMQKILGEVSRILASGRRAVIMMGDTVIKDERVNTTELLLRRLPENELSVEKLIVRIPKSTEASYAAGQRRNKERVGIKLPDHLVILRRK